MSLFQQVLLAVNRPLYPFRETGPGLSRSHLISAFELGFLNAISLFFALFVRAGAKIPIVPVEFPPPLDVINRNPLHTEAVPRLVKEERRARTKGTTTGRMSIQAISDLTGWGRNAALHALWRCDASRLQRAQMRDAISASLLLLPHFPKHSTTGLGRQESTRLQIAMQHLSCKLSCKLLVTNAHAGNPLVHPLCRAIPWNAAPQRRRTLKPIVYALVGAVDFSGLELRQVIRQEVVRLPAR